MSDGIIRLTRQQVREVDRRAIEHYHVPGIVLMENAARAVFNTLHGIALKKPQPFAIVCGGGNNGGDGLAIARHLHNAGHHVRIFLTVDPAKYTGDAATNWQIVQAMKLPVAPFEPTALKTLGPCIIVDAIFGTGLTQPPRDPFAQIATAINESGNHVVAVDLPSGLDCDTGKPLAPTIVRAQNTVTFVAPKAGFSHVSARPYLGRVTVADIGCPRQIIDEILAGR
jgi:NAD(P)H-hydrate epimerase